jgi:hypothetical protein
VGNAKIKIIMFILKNPIFQKRQSSMLTWIKGVGSPELHRSMIMSNLDFLGTALQVSSVNRGAKPEAGP